MRDPLAVLVCDVVAPCSIKGLSRRSLVGRTRDPVDWSARDEEEDGVMRCVGDERASAVLDRARMVERSEPRSTPSPAPLRPEDDEGGGTGGSKGREELRR